MAYSVAELQNIMKISIQPISAEQIDAMLLPIIKLHGSIKGGKTQGGINRDSGRWAEVSKLCDRSRNGRAQGKRNLESGHWALISQRSATDRAKVSQRVGKAAVVNRTGIFAPDYDKSESGREGGRVAGRMNVESGHMERMQLLARHRRWHVLGSFMAMRGIWVDPKPSPKCDLCIREGLVTAHG